jgi:hypothetical protein
MTAFFAILSFLDPLVKLWVNWFNKDQKIKDAKLAAWEAQKNKLSNSASKSYDMKTSYDTEAAEQDARIAQKESDNASGNK